MWARVWAKVWVFYHYPKKSYFKVLQFSLLLMISVLTISPIAVQVPMNEIFGNGSCYLYWISVIGLCNTLTIFGFGMAVFRLECIFNLFPYYVEPKVMSKYIIMAETILLVTLVGTNMTGNMFWCTFRAISIVCLLCLMPSWFHFRCDTIRMGECCHLPILHESWTFGSWNPEQPHQLRT